MKITLGLNRKKYSHNMNFHVNTTSSFGNVQPFLSQFLQANDKVKVSDFRQLIRNGLMPSPTFGQIKCENKFYFVPISEVFPNYDALLSDIPVTGNGHVAKVTSVPYVKQSDLVACLLSPYFSEFRMMKNAERQADDYEDYTDTYFDDTSTSFLDLVASFGFDDTALKSLYNMYLSIGTPKQASFNPVSYDYVLYQPKSLAGVPVCFFKLNDAGRRLYSVLRGLGYSMAIDDDSSVSILPLLAFYKAYVDNYVNKNSFSWPNSVGYRIVNRVSNDFTTLISFGDGGYSKDMRDLLLELSEMFYTHSDDFVSMNRLDVVRSDFSTVVNSPNSSADEGSSSLRTPISSSYDFQPAIQDDFTLIDLDTLKRLTHFVNKNSVIGKKLNDWVRIHYGDSVANELFSDARSVATFVTDVRLDDIYSNSDTETSSDGSALGQRAGIGQGFSSKNSFDFSAPAPGFLIGFFTIFPVSSYIDGNDPQLHMLDRFSFPSSEWDALGYELTPLDVFYSNSVFVKGKSYLKDKAFGFVPRLSNLKYKKSILNGDMAMRSTRDFLSSYHLDNFVKRYELGFIPTNDHDNFSQEWERIWLKNQGAYIGKMNSAGKFIEYDERVLDDPFNYNYVGKYPNIGNYDRIFAQHMNDNFFVQFAVDMTVSNKLKPLSQSFDTFDTTHDNDSVDVDNRS